MIKNLKLAVDESIAALRDGFGHANGLTEETRIIDAQKKGVLTAKNIIFKIYKHGEANNVNHSKWIVSRIKKLMAATDVVTDKLYVPLLKKYDEISERDESKANTFHDNKNKASEAIFDILESNNELQKLLDSQDPDGNIVVEEESDFKDTWCEKKAREYVKSGTKAGYNAEIDAVVICPRGSIGEIRDIYGLRIALPKPPTKSHFLNYKERVKEDQFWTRTKLPNNLKIEHAEQHEAFIEKEFERKRNGAWFYNNGNPEYLTGAHWFLLQHGRTDADGDDLHEHGYFHFRSAHRDIFYFMEAVWVDKRCLGLVYEKTRRTGATYCMVGFSLCKAVTSLDSHFGLTSKTGDDAMAIFNIMIVRMFQNLPFYFKPNRTTDSPKSEYEFRQISLKRSKKNAKDDYKDTSLNTGMSYKNTTNDAYDQYALKLYIGDEFSKWKKPGNINDHWRMISRAMTKGQRITGKAFLLSTVENVKGYDDPTDKDAGSGDKFKYLYYNSDPKKRNSNGRTSTGLYKLFIPCDDNFEGFIDLYGYPVKRKPEIPIKGVDGELITSGILDFLEAEVSSLQTQEEVYNFWRLNPRNEEEGFRVATADSIYDVKRLDTQLNYNNQYFNDDLYIQGDFVWKNGKVPESPHEAEVEFVPNPNTGRFLVAWVPEPHERNRKLVRNGIVRPFNTDTGVFAGDPFRVVQTVNRSGSNGSIHGITSFTNTYLPQGKFFLEYIYRPEDPDAYSWDMIKICVFYGMQTLIESNVPDTLKFMYDKGYTGYAMRRPDKPAHKYSEQERRYGGMPASVGNIDSLSNVLGWYIKNYVGGDEKESQTKMPFNRTITDWMKFKKENRTKHDATVSSSLAIFANRHDIHIDRSKGNQNGKHVDRKIVKLLTHKGI